MGGGGAKLSAGGGKRANAGRKRAGHDERHGAAGAANGAADATVSERQVFEGDLPWCRGALEAIGRTDVGHRGKVFVWVWVDYEWTCG